MNVQTYQQCIQSLQKEIKSRQQQRRKMSHTIEQLSQQLEQEIQKNKLSREEVNYIMKNNESLVQQLHERERAIHQHLTSITHQQTADQFMRQKTVMLETQKKNFQQELKQRDAIIKQTNYRVRDLQVQVKKAQSLVEGYRNILNQKAKEIAKLQTRANQAQLQTDKLALQLVKTKQQVEAERHQMQFRLQHSRGTAEETVTQYQQRIASLLSQLSQTKQLHTNQLATLQFNHTQQIKQLQQQVTLTKKQALHYIEVIQQMRHHDKQLKRQFDAQQQNKDQVVNQLINEINFLKDQKVEIQKTTETRLQSVSQEILKIEMQKTSFQQKVQQMETEIQQKDEKISKITKQLTTLRQQKKHYQTQYLHQKDISFKRGQEIFQLNSQIAKLTKTVTSLQREKQSTTNNISKQLTILRQQNIDLQRTLLTAQAQLHQSKLTIVQLQQQVKELTYERYSTAQNKTELLQFKKNHQTTIQNIQAMLQQSQKVIREMNRMMQVKLREIDVLEASNQMFRNEKLEWLRKEDQYRKKIVELRNFVGGNGNGRRTVVMGDGHNGAVRNHHRANTEYHKMGAQSMLGSPGGQNNLSLHTLSMPGNTPRHKTITPINWLQRIHTLNQTNPINNNIHSTLSNDELSISVPQIHEPYANSGAYRQQSKSFKMKTSQSHQISQPLTTQPMKKKQKLHFVVENGQSKSSLRKDRSVGRINALMEKD